MLKQIQSMDQLQSELTGQGDLVVTVTQPSTCAPCRALKPHLEKAAGMIDTTAFLVVDLDVVPDAIEFFGVRSVPTVLKYSDGELVGPVEGRTVLQLVNELG